MNRYPSQEGMVCMLSCKYNPHFCSSEILTDRPTEGTPGQTPAVARGDMTDVDESAVDKNASFGRIRQSTRCQQKGDSEVEAAAAARLSRRLGVVGSSARLRHHDSTRDRRMRERASAGVAPLESGGTRACTGVRRCDPENCGTAFKFKFG